MTPAASAEPAESSNIGSGLTEEDRGKLVEAVLRDHEDAIRSRAARMNKLREFTELYAGLMKPKIFPHVRAANVNLNILSYASLQTHARLYDMIWPDNGKLIYSWPSTVDDFERAALTEKYSNSYLRNKMPEMAQGLDDSLAQLVIYGSTFRHTYWDGYEGRARSDWVPIEDFVVNHSYRSQDPSLRDVPCYAVVMHPTLGELQMRGKAGYYDNVDAIKAEDEDLAHSDLKDVIERIDGTSRAGDRTEGDKPRYVILQYRTWKLSDGEVHWVAATVDKQSRKLLRLIVREEDDPEDAKRFAKENGPYQDYLIKQEAYEQDAQRRETMSSTAPQGLAVALAPMAPPPLMPPTPVMEPAPTRQRQISYSTHYRAFPSEGFYGLGFGDFIGPIHKACNTLLNQHIDGVTLRNARPGFISRQMKIPRGNVNAQPGVLVEVDAPVSTIRDGIVFLDPPLNDPTTMPLLKLLIDICDKFTGSSDIMSGSSSSAERTAKEVQILNAQLMKQISILAKRVREALRHEFDKLWRLWGTFLPDEPEPTDVIDPLSGGPERLPISRRLFVPDARVFPAADARMRFEKIDEAMQKFAIVTQNPMLMQNPMVLRAVTEDVLKAHDSERLIQFLPPPQGPPPPPQPKPPFEEEAGWLREQDAPVHPADDDLQHIHSHMARMHNPLVNGPPEQGGISNTGRQMAERHIRAHHAAIIQKQGQQLQGPPPGPPGMPPGMGPPPGPPGMGPPPGPPQLPPGGP